MTIKKNNKKISPVVGMKIVRRAWNTVTGMMQCFIKKRIFLSQGGSKYGL